MTWDRQAAQSAWDARMEQERDLAVRLAEWIGAEGIAEGDVAAEVAETLSESPDMQAHAAALLATGQAPQALTDAAAGVASIAAMDPDKRAAEEYLYGHGEKPRRPRRKAA